MVDKETLKQNKVLADRGYNIYNNLQLHLKKFDGRRYYFNVYGNDIYNVVIPVQTSKDNCSCQYFEDGHNICEHICAANLYVHDIQNGEEPKDRRSTITVNKGLYGTKEEGLMCVERISKYITAGFTPYNIANTWATKLIEIIDYSEKIYNTNPQLNGEKVYDIAMAVFQDAAKKWKTLEYETFLNNVVKRTVSFLCLVSENRKRVLCGDLIRIVKNDDSLSLFIENILSGIK